VIVATGFTLSATGALGTTGVTICVGATGVAVTETEALPIPYNDPAAFRLIMYEVPFVSPVITTGDVVPERPTKFMPSSE
jgi:hypothetical protein